MATINRKAAGANNDAAWAKAWDDVQTLRPIILAHRDDGDTLRRLPDAIAQAFVERDVYRLALPVDLGGAGLDPLQAFDLTVEVSRSDASTGWIYGLATSAPLLAGVLPPEQSQELFSIPDCAGAASGPPQGRAVAADEGYFVTGRFAWASGIHHAGHVIGGCLVFDGEKLRTNAEGRPAFIHVIVPRENVDVLDTWHTCGMRGTGSTEFTLTNVFVPEAHAFQMFGGIPSQPHPLFKLPTSFFGFALAAVPLGTALAAIDELKTFAKGKKLPPPRTTLAEQASAQYAIAKGEAMAEAALHGIRHAFSQLWDEIINEGEASLTSRARLRRALVHGVDTSIEAVSMCFREAGGSAVFQSSPFERAMRDVYTVGGHVVFQRAMMEDAGRVELGLTPLLGMF